MTGKSVSKVSGTEGPGNGHTQWEAQSLGQLLSVPLSILVLQCTQGLV